MYRILRCALIFTVIMAANAALMAICAFPCISCTFLAVAGMQYRRGRAMMSRAFGSARWATPDDVGHLLDGTGLIVGRMKGRPSRFGGVGALFDLGTSSRAACQRFLSAFRHGPRPVVRLTSAVHTAVFAPTGAGKGVSCVIPYLLTSPDSAVVVDFKGENYQLTHEARRRMGHRIVVLDPYKIVTDSPDTFNPLQFINPDSETALDDCRDLAEMLVVRTPGEKEPHWADSAEVWIAAMTAVIATHADGDHKTFQSVRALLTDPARMADCIRLMCESTEMNGMLSRLGHQLGHFKDKELCSTLTTTNRFMRFLDTSVIADSTASSSFNPADLRRQKMTIYLVLPVDRMRAQSALLRLWIGSLLRGSIAGGLGETNKVHFLLDEAASIGHLASLDDAVNQLRGYGVRLTFIWQSIGQLKTCFPEGQEQTLLSNTTQIFFAVNDHATAEYVSNRLGETTIVVASGGRNSGQNFSRQAFGQGDSRSFGSSESWQYTGRKLLKPEEVAALPPRTAITFTPGVPPIQTQLLRYYEPEFQSAFRFRKFKLLLHTLAMFLVVGVLAFLLTFALVLQQMGGFTHRTSNPQYTPFPPNLQPTPYRLNEPRSGHGIGARTP